MELFIREPVASGVFYPSEPNELKKELKKLFGKEIYKEREGHLNGLISPHAGYLYSGKVAGKVYYRLSKYKKRTFIIIGPNHTGIGEDISISINASYWTPLGKVKIDQKVGKRICEKLNIEPDFLGHAKEHSIEVQLPFLQYIYGDIKIVPITIKSANLSTLKKLGKIISEENATIIASSDFTHYGEVYGYTPFEDPKIEIREYDLKAIEYIQKLDVDGFYDYAINSTICGYMAITALLEAMKQRNADPEFITYATSGDITGDYSNVVGYAGLIFK